MSTVKEYAPPLVAKALCDDCRGQLANWMAGDEDSLPYEGCEACEERVADAVLGARSLDEAAGRLILMGLLTDTLYGFEFPSVAQDVLHHTIKRYPRVARKIMAIVALHGTDALVAEFWDNWWKNEQIEKRIESYDRETAERLLLMPHDAFLLDKKFGREADRDA